MDEFKGFYADNGGLTFVDKASAARGGLEHLFGFFFRNFMIPTDEVIFFRGFFQPPSSFAGSILWTILLWK